jgi:protein-disulfide isomerase
MEWRGWAAGWVSGRLGAMSDFTSAPIPPLDAEEHVRGEGKGGVIVYADLGCPHCAGEWGRINERFERIAFRHFPVARKHPRAPALHAAAEAAGRQGRFFELVDSLYGDRGRVDDPHLWERAERLGLELGRFEADRRSAAVEARIRRDFESGIRAGVTGTPAVFDACTLTAVREREF